MRASGWPSVDWSRTPGGFAPRKICWRPLFWAICKKSDLTLLYSLSVSFNSDAFSSLRGKEEESLGRALLSSRGVETKPSLSPLVANLKSLCWNYLKSKVPESAGLGYWLLCMTQTCFKMVCILTIPAIFGCRAPSEKCAQRNIWEKFLIYDEVVGDESPCLRGAICRGCWNVWEFRSGTVCWCMNRAVSLSYFTNNTLELWGL